MKKIIVFGGDERNYYLCRRLYESGCEVTWAYAEMFSSSSEFCERGDSFNGYAAILPLPLSRDNETLNAPYCEKKVRFSDIDLSKFKLVFTSDDKTGGINYFINEAVTIDNARLTAVGFLSELLKFEKGDILTKKALITGYGRVSQAVSDILYRLGLNVTVAARNENQRHLAASRGLNAIEISQAAKKLYAYDYVINTVPKKLFETPDLKKADENTVFFELASALIDSTQFVPRAYIECKGVPGRHTPKAAGEVIADFVLRTMRE